MSTYAAKTTIAPEKSRFDIENTLKKYGATGFGYAEQNGCAAVMFTVLNSDKTITLGVRMMLPLPSMKDRSITHNAKGWVCSEANQEKNYQQALRQRWRAMLLVVKAKLEACSAGISTIEREFLPDVVDPGTGRTVGESVFPALTANYKDPRHPIALLPGVPS